jgi:hypothetical protein
MRSFILALAILAGIAAPMAAPANAGPTSPFCKPPYSAC